LAGRIYLANVGANASHRFAGPVYPDGAFEFLPIPEDRDLPGGHAVRYRDLRSFYEPSADLLRFVPKRLWEWPAHNDPEFDSFTYGDNCATTPRAAALRRVEPGDFLFFLARLEQWSERGPGGEHGFYFVGYLHVEEILREVSARPSDGVLGRYRANAHVRRGLSDSGLWDRFWVFKGSALSRRFHKAVPVTRGLASRIFTSADGSPWRWDSGRTDLQVIGSYTRSCRCVIDPSRPGHGKRAEALWESVKEHSS
jgi:hypothetical protein